MPYKLSKSKDGYYVLNEAGERKSEKPLSRSRAVAYMRALYAAEKREIGKTKDANIAQWFEASIHQGFTNLADDAFKEGRLTRDERISLSSAIGDALGAFVKKLEETNPELYKRGPWDTAEPSSPSMEVDPGYARMEAKDDGPSTGGAPVMVFKQADGRYRWVTFSSNAYRDRDREIVSTAALEADCARADKEGGYGPLRWWHVGKPDALAKVPGPGADIGACDYNAMHGKILVESGTFSDERIAQAVASKAADLQVSIGFFHPLGEPDGDGVFHTIRRFERSLLPRGRASNPLTSLFVVQKEEVETMLKEKLEALKALLSGDEALVKSVLEQAEKAESKADEVGTEFKEQAPEPEQPAEVEAKADEVTEAETPETPAEEEAEEMEPVIGDMTRDEFTGVLADALSKAIEPYTKELNAMKAQAKRKDDEAVSLKEALTEQAKTITALKAQLDELSGSQPRAANRGYRASQAEETVVKETSTVKGKSPQVDPDFAKFAFGGGQ